MREELLYSQNLNFARNRVIPEKALRGQSGKRALFMGIFTEGMEKS